jgi:hypothetical protein
MIRPMGKEIRGGRGDELAREKALRKKHPRHAEQHEQPGGGTAA